MREWRAEREGSQKLSRVAPKTFQGRCRSAKGSGTNALGVRLNVSQHRFQAHYLGVMTLACFSVGFWCLSSRAQEDVSSGNYWLEQCTPTSLQPRGGYNCTFFLSGVNEYNRYLQAMGTKLYCPQDGVTLGQMQNVVLKYLQDNPAQLHHPFIALVIAALTRAFPCT